jgi:1-acyl-sn-glycerol-3-phosphate acyltransferase
MTLFLNILFWAFFGVTSFVLCGIALVIRLVTGPFDRNLRILQKFSGFWASLYIWANPFWSVGSLKGIEQVDPKKAYVIVSNHQSMADILILFRSFLHFKWVAKKSLFNLPLLGWNMRLNGYVPITRGDEKSREECLKQCADWLKKGSSVLFFPEGTRSKDGRLQPFKPGAFRLALETGHEILPVVISGTLHAIPKHSILLHGRSRMSMKVLPPISLKNLSGDVAEQAKQLSQKAHDVMEKAMGEIS